MIKPLSNIAGEIGIFRRVAMPSANPLAYLAFRLGVIGEARLRYGNGEILLTRNSAKTRGFTFAYNERDLRFVPLPLYEVFIEEVYRKLRVKGRMVVDVGGSIGDTAAYFVHRGAKKVIVIEPDDFRYRTARSNIEKNKLGGMVELHREKAEAMQWRKMGKGLLLKVDCEGCEYGLIGSIDLSRFDEIIIEYHRGSWRLERILGKSGFLVEITKEEDAQTGVLYACR